VKNAPEWGKPLKSGDVIPGRAEENRRSFLPMAHNVLDGTEDESHQGIKNLPIRVSRRSDSRVLSEAPSIFFS
jgi:hypothetical protein